MAKQYSIAAIPGDGIGKEVIGAGLEVLAALTKTEDFDLTVKHFDWNSDRYLASGEYIPQGGLDELKTFDAIFFGAVGSPKVADHVSLWGLRLPICQGFDQYANVRPARVLPGVESPLRLKDPGDLDWVIIRENSEGEYSGHGGRAHRGLPEEVATEVSIFTRAGVTRIHRFAFELARKRPRKHLTLVTKSNAQRHGMVLWDEIFMEVAHEYADVTWDRELVDDHAHLARAVSTHARRKQSACRHLVGPRRRFLRQSGPCTDESIPRVVLRVRPSTVGFASPAALPSCRPFWRPAWCSPRGRGPSSWLDRTRDRPTHRHAGR